MRKIAFTKQALKKLKQINKSTPQVAKSIKNLLLSLAKDVEQVRGETLQGYSTFKKFRVGKYRVIYTYDKTTVTVAILDKREVVYQSFEKFMKNSDFKI